MCRWYKVLILGCFCALLTGCVASKSADIQTTEHLHGINNELVIEQEEPLKEIHWKLIGIMGKAVFYKSHEREPYITLKIENNHLQGFGGCNIFMGTYELLEENKLSFAKVASTKMACPKMAEESAFLKALTQVNHYTITDGVLILYKADKTILATFEPVYPQ